MMEPLTLTLCFQDDLVLLNASIIEILEHPKQVQILINDEEKMLALRVCSVEDPQAIVLPKGMTQEVEIGGRVLLKKIKKLTGWSDDQTRVLYGDYMPSHQAVRFRLMEAEPLQTETSENPSEG